MKKKIKMAIKMKSKKADSKLLSLWWFIILAIIGTAVVIATLVFFSAKIDVRLSEDDILDSRILSCVAEKGIISEDFLSRKLSVLDSCGLKKEILENTKYFIKIQVYDEQDVLKKENIYGNNAFDKDCIIGSKVMIASYFPRCLEY